MDDTVVPIGTMDLDEAIENFLRELPWAGQSVLLACACRGGVQTIEIVKHMRPDKPTELFVNGRKVWEDGVWHLSDIVSPVPDASIIQEILAPLGAGFECSCCGARGLEPCEGDCVGGERRQEFDAE